MQLINEHLKKISDLCDIHHVDRLYVFGSVVNVNAQEVNDVDFLVKFLPIELSEYFDNYHDLKSELEKVLSLKVDLVEEQSLKNQIFIKELNASKKLIYEFKNRKMAS